METTITVRSDNRDEIDDLIVQEGERKMKVSCTMKGATIEFDYYCIRKWEYPFHEDPFTDEDRARLASKIYDYFTPQGWHFEVDHRRSCPRCYEKLDGSEFDDWPGGTCDFCGKEIDQHGNIVSQ
jgi:hypothetical protein